MKLYFRYFICSLILACWLALPAMAQIENRDDLERELRKIEDQINLLAQELSATKTAKQQLQQKIKELRQEQNILKLRLKATAIRLNKLGGQITATEKSISATIKKSALLQSELTDLIRLINQTDGSLMLELLTKPGLSDIFTELNNYSKLSAAVANLAARTKQLRQQLNSQRAHLGGQQNDARHLLSIQSIQNNELKSRLTEEAAVLTETQGRESAYQQLLADRKKQAAAIRNRIYELFEAKTQITFGEAVEIADATSKITGVRAAYLLAILTQESNLGKNVGTCNRAGDPPEKGWRQVMKPERDQEPFLQITAALGLNADITPVSCPMKGKNGKQIGWGGAMGPAQFIPSTWLGYKDKVAALTGRSIANPWDIRDAFAAAGLKLAAGGAASKNGEWAAAMRYFSGSTNPRFRFYGDNVLKLADRYQKDIETLK